MANIETGDILHWSSGPGHIGMAFDGRSIIHAQMKGNFHIDADQMEKDGVITYLSNSSKLSIFRPPWDKLGAGAAAKKAELRRVAELLSRRAEYGAWRAVRLLLGDSKYGPNTASRLAKYRQRMNGGVQPIIATVSCSEAVIVTYQLAFPLGELPFFIRLDGAHAMPSTLATWLGLNGWSEV